MTEKQVIDHSKMIRKLIYMIMTCTLLAACSDEKMPFEWGDPADELALTLHLPDFTAGTRAVDENVISDLRVLYFDNTGAYLSESMVERSKMTGTHPNYSVKLPVPPTAARVELVVNYGKALGGNPATAVIDALPEDNIVMWGTITVEDLKKPSPAVWLLRASAKTTVECSATDFTVIRILHYGASTTGMVAPETEGAVNIPDPVESEDEREVKTDAPYYFYETEKGKCYMLIHGKYKDLEGWYKIAYIPREGDEAGKEIPLLRNHWYQFTIAEVNDYGWKSKEEAMNSKPDNRMTVDLKDNDEAIYNMIACRDYELGVSKDIHVEADANTAEIDILTSYKNKDGNYSYSVECAEQPLWVKGWNQTSVPSVAASSTQSPATHYKVSVSIQPNDKSEEERSVTLTVRSGDLSREVRIIQAGSDLKRTRKAYIYNLEGVSSPVDYFDFMDNTLQGDTEEEMGVARNNCLHFRVYGNNYYYTIPYRDGDQVSIVSGGNKFSVTRDGSNWKVTSNGNDNYELWDGEFTISNSVDNNHLSYEVCHRGLFHQLHGSNQISGPNEDTERTGWFYYEQINTVGNDGKTYHVLDRNMGATSNLPYSESSALYSDNIGARGGYFKIANQKGDMALINGIAPSGYEVPAAYHLQQLKINVSNNVDAIPNVTVSEGYFERAFERCYFPIAGYMEGSIHKDQAHACLWSQSLLSGNQGFSEDSEEYGWWFRYLDVYGERISLGNTRITTRGGEPRAMTVRCLHGPAVPDGWNIPDPGTNRKRVVVRNLPDDDKDIWCTFDNCPGGWPKMYAYGANSRYYDVPQSITTMKVRRHNTEYTLNLSVSLDWTWISDSNYKKTK